MSSDVAIGDRHRPVGDPVQQPDLLDAADQDEEADEEEDRWPLDLGQDRMDLDPAEEQEQDGAEHGDRAGLVVQHAVEDEAEDRQRRVRSANGAGV